MFAWRAVEEGLKLPEVHLLINNRVSEYELRSTLKNNYWIKIVFRPKNVGDSHGVK